MTTPHEEKGVGPLTDVTIEVRGLRRRYAIPPRKGASRGRPPGSRRPETFEAVKGLDLQVRRGELFALLGTNGAGKTSALELVEGLARPSGGTVRVLGHDPYAERATVRPQIGIMLQEAGFPGGLTVNEMATAWHRTLSDPRPVGETLEMVALEHRSTVAIDSLSGGERRRLDLALTLMGQPSVVFLDEPTTGLDPQSRHRTWQLIRGLLEEQTTVLLTTHYLEEAEALADRIAIMHEGLIAREGTLADIVSRQPTRISFRLADDARAGESLAMLRRVGGAGFHTEQRAGGHAVSLETFDAQPLLTQLLGWAHDRTQLADLRVLPGSLEQAFLDVARKDNTPTSLEEAA
jgi:ABC-2 type transport system ATP-binding protein